MTDPTGQELLGILRGMAEQAQHYGEAAGRATAAHLEIILGSDGTVHWRAKLERGSDHAEGEGWRQSVPAAIAAMAAFLGTRLAS